MAKINLLPWRDDLRKQKQEEFMLAIGAGVLATCSVFFLVFLHIEGMKEYQQGRNQMLQEEIRIVDRKIKEIKDIESKKRQLLTKIEVIQKLQESRPQIVHLFEELAKSTPEGVHLSKFKQTGQALAFSGKAQSNARVSAYMRGVDASPWLESPVLKVIQGKGKAKNGQLNDFSMLAKQGVNKPKEQEGKK
jgi:type IV pilus assembly protein PilN